MMNVDVVVRDLLDGTRVLQFTGEIDSFTSPGVKAVLWKHIDDRRFDLLLNLSGVRYIDSTGLGVFVGALRYARAHGGRIDIVCSDPQIKKLFGITGLSNVFRVFDTERLARSA
jgi:anti-sigma B factor antagonist